MFCGLRKKLVREKRSANGRKTCLPLSFVIYPHRHVVMLVALVPAQGQVAKDYSS